MTAPSKEPGTSVAKAAPNDTLDRIGKLHVAQIKQQRALTMALRNQAWGKSLSPQMQSAVAEYMRRFKLDITEVEVLGGNIYRTGYYYRRRIAEMRTKGIVEDSGRGAGMIGPDVRLDEAEKSDNPDIASWAKAENFRRLRERIRWEVPADATHAYVVGIKLRSDASVLEGCDWITPTRMKKVKDWEDGKFKGWKEAPADPVGAEEPEKTVITRAWRRCGLLVAAEIPELRTEEEAMNASAEIVDAQIEQIGEREQAQIEELSRPSSPLAMPAQGDPYGEPAPSSEPEPVSAEPKRSAAFRFKLPYGPMKGTSIGAVPPVDLDAWYGWAREQPDPDASTRGFIAAYEELQNERDLERGE